MARLNVNPTRMELSNLKRRLTTARRGHKLLKDKRDELMKRFLDLVRQNKDLRREVEETLGRAYDRFVMARAVMSAENLEEALMFPTQRVEADVTLENVMSVTVPRFDIQQSMGGNLYPYGLADTSGELDGALANLSDALPKMLELAQMEKAAQLLAQEIEKTRRRVNALEYVMIPQFEETIKFITMKLDENERGNITRLMKVKDMMVEEQIRTRQGAK